MAPRFRRTAKMFAAVAGTYLVYSLAVVPVIEPPAVRREPLLSSLLESSIPSTMVPLREANLETLFSPGDWELDNPMVVKTDRGMLLIRDYRTREDGSLELVPCTLILADTGPGRSATGIDGPIGSQRPVLLRSPQGAVIRFDRPLDLTRGQFGQLESGWLVGPVTIQSPESRPGANDALDLRTDSIQITRERIIAPHDVIFRYGENTGRGRDLIINLGSPPDQQAGSAAENEAFGQLRSLELVHVEGLRLRLPKREEDIDGNDGRAGGTDKTDRPAAELDRLAAARFPLPDDVHVTCRGPFRMDFQRLVATLEDQVEMVQKNVSGPHDRMTADLLSIVFARTEPPDPQPASAATADRLRPSGMAVTRIVLQGTPARLDIPSAALAAQAQRMEYHPETRQIQMMDPRQAVLRYQQHEFRGKQVHYVPGDDGQLGHLVAEGPGLLRGASPDEPEKVFEASWQDRLVVQPHQGDQAISLLGGAQVRYEGMGEFAANDLHLWLQEIPAASDAGQPPRFVYRPVRMLAEGAVRVDSPQLVGGTEKVEVWIRHESATPEHPPTTNVAGPGSFGAPSKPSPQQFDLTGDHLQVQLLQSGNDMVVEHLILDGNVRLRELQTARPGETPLNASGQLIQLENANTPQTRMLVLGAPAEVAARQMAVVGERIQMNRERNRMWIPGAGSMRLPLAATALQPGSTTGSDVSPGSMTIQWQDRMVFDGRVAQFAGGVRLRGEQPSKDGQVFDLLLAGEHLDVTLTQRIDFSADKPPTDVHVGYVAFRGDVLLQNASLQQGQRTSIDRMHVRDLTIDQPSGRLKAAGPGWGSSVRRNQQIQAGPAERSAAAQITGTAADLVYVRVDFEDQIVGNLHDRAIEFHGRVRTLYGPVADWRDRLEPDPRDGLAAGVYLLTSDRLVLAETPVSGNEPAAFEVIADGNTTVEGNRFTARAWRVSYARAKELLILQGDGRNDAELWLKGSVTPDAAAQQIRFWTHNNSIQVDGARFFQLSQTGLWDR